MEENPAVVMTAEATSSVEIKDLAKGPPAITVKAYGSDLTSAMMKAVQTYNETKYYLENPEEFETARGELETE